MALSSPPPLDPEKPLAAASARLKKAKSPPKVDPGLVIGLKAGGVPQSKIAEVLHVEPNTIMAVLNRTPHAREMIADLRENLKLVKIRKANEVEGRMWARLSKEVDEGDARDVDAMARALLASEKIQAGVAGEGAASGASLAINNPTGDIKVLIQALLDR